MTRRTAFSDPTVFSRNTELQNEVCVVVHPEQWNGAVFEKGVTRDLTTERKLCKYGAIGLDQSVSERGYNRLSLTQRIDLTWGGGKMLKM